ncbi:MAG: 1-acyl-sn-glycerol-3-phosphate acyltransferase [Saprospiraceae bacterium]|nr:1-acyl-sn-glycerol-3-phosphate acyltransferase [Saprospiraceae bacterium]
MNPILYILYYFFKYLVRFTTWVYYAKISITGEPHHRSRNPCILVSNHPSTMLDPLNVAIRVNAEIKFLANASLFRNPIASWLLRKLYCIPVERYQDTGGKPLDNAASFEQATKHLAGNGCLYVAPEGSSFVERRLRKIKTGTARIAFDAEKRNNWQLGLTILPVGLNYTDPTKFRSELLTVFGKPIRVADFRELHEADPMNAVYCLTEAIGEHIGELIIDCEDGHQDQLLQRLELVLQNEKQLAPTAQLHRSRSLLVKLKLWKERDSSSYEAFQQRVFAYFEKIKSLKISDLQVSQAEVSVATPLALAATVPLFLAGWLSHILPCFFTKKITDSLNADDHWVPTYKFTAGVVLYPVFIGLQAWLVGLLAAHFGFSPSVKWAYLLAIIPLGLVAEWWLKTGKRWLQGRRAAVLRSNGKAEWGEIIAQRQRIIQHMEVQAAH